MCFCRYAAIFLSVVCLANANAAPKCAQQKRSGNSSVTEIRVSSQRAYCPADSEFAYLPVQSRQAKNGETVVSFKRVKRAGLKTAHLRRGKILRMNSRDLIIENVRLDLESLNSAGAKFHLKIKSPPDDRGPETKRKCAGIFKDGVITRLSKVAPIEFEKFVEMEKGDLICDTESEYAFLLEDLYTFTINYFVDKLPTFESVAQFRVVMSPIEQAHPSVSNYKWLGKRFTLKMQIGSENEMTQVGHLLLQARPVSEEKIRLYFVHTTGNQGRPLWDDPPYRSCTSYSLTCGKLPNGETMYFANSCEFEDSELPAADECTFPKDSCAKANILEFPDGTVMAFDTFDNDDTVFRIGEGEQMCIEPQYSYVLESLVINSEETWSAMFRVVVNPRAVVFRTDGDYEWLGKRFLISSEHLSESIGNTQISGKLFAGKLHVRAQRNKWPYVEPNWFPYQDNRVCAAVLYCGLLPNGQFQSISPCEAFDKGITEEVACYF